jgi:hypothetical protein
MTVEQESPDRAAIANEVWETAEKSPETTVAEVVEVVAPEVVEPVVAEVDPWAGVPVALREEFEGMKAKVQGLEKIDFRLKQTESRLGSVQNELHAAKEAAKAVTNAPSKEQIAEAAASQGDWDALKEDFPEWTKATEGRLAAERAEILKQLPDVKAIREEIQTAAAVELETFKEEMAGDLVEIKHPKWREIQKSPDFLQWHKANGERNSFKPSEVIQIFDDYEAHLATRKSPKEIAEERRQRLEQSQTTEGRRLPPTKSEADMTPSEIRAAAARQVWGET